MIYKLFDLEQFQMCDSYINNIPHDCLYIILGYLSDIDIHYVRTIITFDWKKYL